MGDTPLPHAISHYQIDGTLALAGELGADSAAGLEQWLSKQGGVVQLDLSGLELAESLAVVRLVNAIRALAERSSPLCVFAAPHLLAHNLYRCGLLQDGHIVLASPREELPYG